MNKSTKKLLEMLSYKRKEGSVGQKLFNERFIQPMMGKPDEVGNYLCQVYPDGQVERFRGVIHPNNKIIFMAHMIQFIKLMVDKRYSMILHQMLLMLTITNVWVRTAQQESFSFLK